MSVGIIAREKGLTRYDVIVAERTDVQAYEWNNRWADGTVNSYMAHCKSMCVKTAMQWT